MKEVIELILKQEQQAKAQIEDAQKKAKTLIAKANQQAQEQIQTVTAETKQYVQEQTRLKTKQFLQEKEHILQDIREKNTQMRHEHKDQVPILAQKLFNQLITLCAE